MKNNLATSIIKRHEEMDKDRRNFEVVWEEISEYVAPNRGDFITKRATAERIDRRVFDSTAVHANEMLASALHSGLTNPSSRWFTLSPTDISLLDTEAVNAWIENSLKYMYAVINSPNTGFYQHNHEFLLDICSYGTACMFIDEDVNYAVRFKNVHLSEVRIKENHLGEVDTIHRSFKQTARQAVQQFGEDACPGDMQKDAKDKPDAEYEIIHCVMPKRDYMIMGGDQSINEKQRYVGIYVCCKTKTVLQTAGYYEMPYVVARWEKLVGESYGRSPAWNALSDIRMINVMSETVIRSAQKQIDPPLLMSDDGVMMPLHTYPSGVNIGALTEDGQPLIRPLELGGNLNLSEAMLEQRRDAIRKAFFVDQFAPSEGTPASATERMQIEQTGLRLTGPHLNRLQVEYLTRVIDRVFKILERNRIFPDAPEELSGADLRVEYISPLARNQRAPELSSLNAAVQAALPLIETDPGVLGNVNADDFFRNALVIAGVPRSSIKSQDQLAKERQAAAEQQAQMQQMQAGMAMADTAANLQRSGIDVTQ